MGGTVGFRSTPGKGSEFWMELSLHQKAPRPSPVPAAGNLAASPLAMGEGAHHRIVYIEDNPSNIEFMRQLMEELDRVTLIVAPTAEVGIEIVREQRPDVVIMDINLPGMSGYEATRKLREWPETRDIPVVALSAAAMTGDKKRGAEAGFYRYLTKPVRVAELMETLESLLTRSRDASVS